MEKTEMEYFNQTTTWNKRFKELKQSSPQEKWDWIIGHYQGDQDELDHILNRIK